MELEYLGEVITVVSYTLHRFQLSIDRSDRGTDDPLNRVACVYNFEEPAVPSTNSLAFRVSVATKLMDNFPGNRIYEAHRWVVRFGLKSIKAQPDKKDFLFTVEEYEQLKSATGPSRDDIRVEILEFHYRVNISDQRVGVGIYDLMENFLYDEDQIIKCNQILVEDGFIKQLASKRHKRWGASINIYRLDYGKITQIEEQIGIRASSTQNLIKLSDHQYFHLVETHTQLQGPFAFVLMPFNDIEFPQEVFEIFKTIIRSELDINCVKADDDMRKNYIESKIYSHIVRAEFVIAELSTENPNVIFEFAMALSLNRPVIPTVYKLKRKRKGRLAFDYDHFDTLFYNSYDELEVKLGQALLPFK